MRRARGFTLIELMVVVAIMATVIALGAFMYGQAVRGAKAPGFARSLVAMVNQARQAALSSGTYARLRIAPGTPLVIYSEEQDPNVAATSTDLTTVASWVDLGGKLQTPNDIELCTPDSSANPGAGTPTACPASAAASLCFAPDGSVTTTNSATTCPGAGTGATLYVRTADDAKHYKIYIFGLTGLPRLTDQW